MQRPRPSEMHVLGGGAGVYGPMSSSTAQQWPHTAQSYISGVGVTHNPRGAAAADGGLPKVDLYKDTCCEFLK